ncbi:MAG: glucose-1-phosphate adenylyltransferase [Candidatus Eremiobacteraeota bacterium]|nr:glucose-1-phosphate adenylyltransferase [Candidatus Eremiobacteraeota bacterium]
MLESETPRFVSLLTKATLALILAGGRGTRLKQLTEWRAKPAVPFGGKFRIIDFPLSNCINSGIRRIGVVTQYKAHSLMRHIQRGWGSLRGEFDEFVELLPASQRLEEESWYTGTANAILQNLDIIHAHNPEFVLVLAGDHVYKMDYGAMLVQHVEQKADVTVGCFELPLTDAVELGTMSVDQDNRITGFAEKRPNPIAIPGHPHRALASMGIYCFNAHFLYQQLDRDAQDQDSTHDFGRDVIPYVVEHAKAVAHRFGPASIGGHGAHGGKVYWRDVGTIDAYWEANMDLTHVVPHLNLYDGVWPIWTYQEQVPPAKFVFDEDNRRGSAVNALVAGGCIISGSHVQRSLLFTNVRVNSFSHVEDSVVLPEVNIGRHCRIHRAVVDKGCKLPEGLVVGEDAEHDAKRFYRTESGITLITPDMLGQGRGTL